MPRTAAKSPLAPEAAQISRPFTRAAARAAKAAANTETVGTDSEPSLPPLPLPPLQLPHVPPTDASESRPTEGVSKPKGKGKVKAKNSSSSAQDKENAAPKAASSSSSETTATSVDDSQDAAEMDIVAVKAATGSKVKGKSKAKPKSPAPAPAETPGPQQPARLPTLPTELWLTIFELVLDTHGLGPLFLCASVCTSWRRLIFSNPSPLDHKLVPLCPSYNTSPPSRRARTKSVASALLAQYTRHCEVCHAKAPHNRPQGYMKVWPATYQIMCLACRVRRLRAAGHAGVHIDHPYPTMTRSDVVALGIPRAFVESRMEYEVRQIKKRGQWGPMYLYDVDDVAQVVYALKGRSG